MSAQLLTVEQVATQIGVHSKTIRRYIIEGRLPATRIGKQYRIAADALAAFTGQPAVPGVPVGGMARGQRHVEAATVVQIDAISPEDAMRVMNSVGGAIKGRDRVTDTPLRVETVYDETRARLKVIVTGSLATTTALLQLIGLYAH